MKRAERFWNPICRGCYLLAMYSGLRAWLNRIRSRSLPLDPRLGEIDGCRLESVELGGLAFSVDARRHPAASGSDRNFGLISIRQVEPDIGPLAYRFFCLTSHFGHGHIEVAFYETKGEVSFYAVRNIAQANASRLGLERMSRALKVSNRREDENVLNELSGLIGRLNMKATLAEPEECLQLAIDSRLLRSKKNEAVFEALRRKYHRLHTTLDQRLA